MPDSPTPTPDHEPLPGLPTLALGDFDPAAQGYAVEEHILHGVAQAYRTAEGLGGPHAEPDTTAPFCTRIVVVRPVDADLFNGMAVVEWLNVTPGTDTPPDWWLAHREIMRGGYAYVGVSAQRVGVEGGPSLIEAAYPLKRAAPSRYGRLHHPGDRYSFDIYSQAGRLIQNAPGLLGPLRPRRLLAIGESQSAMMLLPYINMIDPIDRVYDGYLVHSCFGSAPKVDDADVYARPLPLTRLRRDPRVPVLTLITETDLIGRAHDPAAPQGYLLSRVPNGRLNRTWEVAGAAHADNYTFFVSAIDSGCAELADLADAWAPAAQALGLEFSKPMNAFPGHHYVLCAALRQLRRWVAEDLTPPHAPELAISDHGTLQEGSLELDANGNAMGGVRTPWVDVPIARHSGMGNEGNSLAALVGATETYDAATLAKLYGGGSAEYLDRFANSLETAIASGFLLAEDRDEILALAQLNWTRLTASPAAAGRQ
jgi:hypothetical protein